MKTKWFCLAMAGILAAASGLFAQGTAFTYQGRLNDGANPASGLYDLTFTLFEVESGGSAVAGPITKAPVGVTNGLFTVTLDFGNQFPGADRWLEIAVRTNGGGVFSTLVPRQQLTATPYAIYAPSAGSVAGSNIVGSIAQAQLPTNVALRTGGNSFTGDQIMTDGKVGIGTATPGTRLTVATPPISYGIEHTDGSSRLSTFLGNGAWLGTVSPDPFYLFVNDGGPALTIAANQHVGVGTVSPGENSLQIGQPFQVSAGGINGFGLAVNQAINGVGVQINRGANQGGLGLVVDNTSLGDATTSLLLLRNNVGSATRTVLDVQADGKVGIQSSTPGRALQVGDPAVVGSEGMIRLSSRSDTGGGATRTWDIGVPQTGDSASGVGYSFVINDAGLGASDPQFLIQWGTGNVGIGTTNPAVRLDVNGTVRATQFQGPGVLPWQIVSGTSQQAQPNTGYLATNDMPVTVTLPANANVGDIVRVSGSGAAGWKIAQSPGQSVLAGSLAGSVGTTWSGQNSGIRFWQSVASSSDGTKLVAGVLSGQIYTSADSGATWTAQNSGNHDWFSIASSSDGLKLVAVDVWGSGSGGQIYTSTDSGVTWTPRESNRHWYCVACSSDGTKVVAVDWGVSGSGGQIYTSTDSGVTWTPRESNRFWESVASSSDGTKLVAGAQVGRLYTSTDSGVTWTPRESIRWWHSVASSSDGTKLVASDWGNGGTGRIYTSTDSGVTWTPRDSARPWRSVTSSADGSKLVAVVRGGQIYTSADSGATWTARETNRDWEAVASSSDGAKLVAAVQGGQIYTSVRTSVSSTTVGETGYLQGGQNTAIELQYVGNNRFLPISYAGTISVY